MKERLLKRISRWAANTTSEIREPDVNELTLSLQDDLEKMFNTRRGTVLVDDDYGLPDFSHLMNGYDAPDTGQIRRSMVDVAKKYEKRLSAVDVRDDTEKSKQEGLKFILTGTMQHKNQELPFSASVLVMGDGSITLAQR